MTTKPRCTYQVWHSQGFGRYIQCSRKALKNAEFCCTHTPEARGAREQLKAENHAAKRAQVMKPMHDLKLAVEALEAIQAHSGVIDAATVARQALQQIRGEANV